MLKDDTCCAAKRQGGRGFVFQERGSLQANDEEGEDLTLFKGRMRARYAALLLVATLLTLSVAGTVQADTAAVTQAQADTTNLKALVDKLNDQLSAADEEYNYANQQLQDTQARVKTTTAECAAAQKQLDAARQQLSDRVVDIYKRGDAVAVEMLLGSTSLTDLTNRVEQLKRISAQDNTVVSDCKVRRQQLADKKAVLAGQLKQQQAYATKTAQAKTKVESQLATQKSLLKGKEVELAQLQEQEKQQQLVLAAQAREAARQAQLAATQTPTTVRKTTGTIRVASGSTRTTTRSTTRSTATSTTTRSTTSSTRGARVVSIGMQYLGVPYVWAGASPSGFDCSGFVLYVYSKIGVSLPHSSAMQYGYGTHVLRSQLKPGDLVFFYSPIHHVGIYIGNGQMINARGSCVQIDSLWSSYVGATRIVN